MANHRSMLPKFRPATLNASERPKIRPVKPSAPPAPPRRHSSGIRPPEEQSPPTQNYGEPPTMAAARARIHEIARELPAENRFSPHERHNFNDETQGRIEPVDFAAAHAAYDRQFGTPPLGSPDAYDQLPALGHHEHYDAEYQHQDPMTELRPAYDEALERHADNYRAEQQPPYRNDEHQYRSDRPLPEDDSSGEYARRERRSPPPPATYSAASNSYDPAAYEANYPKAPRRDEPSYADRRDHVSSAPKSDRRERHEDRRDERRDEGRSFRRDDFPRESSYRDEPRRDDRDERRDEGRSFRREEARREASYQPPRADETRAEGSSAKHEKRGDSGFDRDRHEPSIPGPAGVPRELRVPDNFVVGVQPIRTPSMGAASAFPQPQAVIAPSYPPAMTAAASPGAMNMNMPMSPLTGGPSLGQMGMPVIPQISMPPMMAPPMTAGMPAMHVRAHTSARPMGHIPQPTEVEEAQQGSKVGRFAWFVFGAAFGIFFAFAATGFGFGKKDDASFPPAPTQLPAPPTAVPAPPPPPPVQPQLAPAPVAPQPGQPMMAQPQIPGQAPGQVPGQPPQMVQQQQQQLAPVAAPQFAPAGVTVAPGQAPISIVPAPGNVQQPPQAQGGQAQAPAPRGGTGTVTVRDTPPRRPAGGARRGGGGARPAAPQNNNDDDAPAPKPKAEPSAADLLGDGLK